MTHIIAVANQKGGVGKTTTNVNLSACIAAFGRRVLTIDIDPQGNTTSGLGVEKAKITHSIYDVLINGVRAEEAIAATSAPGVDILPSSIQLAGAEVEMVSMMAREHILKNALASVLLRYDYILIDCPPSLGLLTINALTLAHKVLVPIQCEYYALEGLSQLVNSVKLVRQHLNAQLEIEGVVMTMFDARTNLSQQVVEEVRRFFRNTVYETVIPRNIRLAEAPSYGLPIHLFDPSSTGAKAYESLARELIASTEKGATQHG